MTGTQAPSIRNGSLDGGTIVISHKEFLGDVITNVTPGVFTSKTYRLNPGSYQTFPWLSQISQNFQQYRFEGLCFHFKSMSADALTNSNTALGSVILCTQYDAQMDPPETKVEMENMEFSQSIKPSQSITHFVECAKSQSPLSELYINAKPKDQTGDKRFYDFGQFTIATQGMQGVEVNIGELWISYQVRLFKPQLYDALGNDAGFFHWGVTAPVGEITNNHPLGQKSISDWVLQKPDECFYPKNNIECETQLSRTWYFEATGVPKTFIIYMYWLGADGSAESNPFLNFSLIGALFILGPLNLGTDKQNSETNPYVSGFQRASTMQFAITTDGKGPWGWTWTGSTKIPKDVTQACVQIHEVPLDAIP